MIISTETWGSLFSPAMESSKKNEMAGPVGMGSARHETISGAS
jgi:hypothetical protein